MDEYHLKQLALQGKIANSFTNFKAKGKVNMTKGAGKARLEGLESYYSTFISNHSKIIKLPDLDSQHDYFKTNLFDLVKQAYFDKKEEFHDFFNSLEPVATAPAQDRESLINIEALLKASFAQSVPKVNIPKFSGKHSDWGNFKDLFRSLIHRRRDLTPVMKLYHLKSLLTDEALDKVKSYPSTDENYTKAWDFLISLILLQLST